MRIWSKFFFLVILICSITFTSFISDTEIIYLYKYEDRLYDTYHRQTIKEIKHIVSRVVEAETKIELIFKIKNLVNKFDNTDVSIYINIPVEINNHFFSELELTNNKILEYDEVVEQYHRFLIEYKVIKNNITNEYYKIKNCEKIIENYEMVKRNGKYINKPKRKNEEKKEKSLF